MYAHVDMPNLLLIRNNIYTMYILVRKQQIHELVMEIVKIQFDSPIFVAYLLIVQDKNGIYNIRKGYGSIAILT